MPIIEKHGEYLLDDKILGFINERGTFVTHREEIHFFVKYHGFGINKELLQILKNRHPELKIKIIYSGRVNKIRYDSKVNDWFIYGNEYKNTIPPYDIQMVLDTKYMRKD